jgi:transposase
MLPVVSRREAMVALANAEVQPQAIAIALQCATTTVRRWVRRIRMTGDPKDRSRSGRPAIYSEESKVRIVAFYCQTQPLPNSGRWTLRWAQRRLLAEPTRVGATPSKSTIFRILESNRLKPHRSRYFLHITDPDFFPKMEHLIDLYRAPPRHLFFFDECPGIQVLKRLTPDLHTDAMKQRLEEFEYIRNGTLDVLAFLHHADGKVVLECHADHTTNTFLDVFRRHVDRFSQTEQLHYVMDNLNTHRSYLCCQVVAELSGVACPTERELSTQVKRAEWLRRQDKRIIIHFTPYHGSWLNWVEIWFGIMGAKVLRESFGAPEHLKAVLEALADEWNLFLAHPFRWEYDGKELHDKAVKRFTAMLRSSAETMDLRIMTKGLLLMTNLLKDYFTQVSGERWDQLAATISAQSGAIAALVEQEEGFRRKKNAQRALDGLTAALQDRSISPVKVAG